MVRIILHSILFTTLILSLGSCSSQLTDESTDTINSLTRALAVNVLDGGNLPADMGLYIDNVTYPEQSVKNILLTQKGNRYESAYPLSWGGTDANISISAYAPYLQGAATEEIPFSVKLNQKTKADYASSDLMWALAPEVVFGQGKLQLSLAHLMAKLIIEINDIAINADPSRYSIENLDLFGFYTTIPFSPKTGELGSRYWQKEKIVPFGEDHYYQALVVPQSAKGLRHVEFDVRNKVSKEVKRFASAPTSLVPENDLLESGKAYKIIVEADFTNLFSTRQATPVQVTCRVMPCHWNYVTTIK